LLNKALAFSAQSFQFNFPTPTTTGLLNRPKPSANLARKMSKIKPS